MGGEGVELRGEQRLHVEVVDVGESVRGHHHLDRVGCRVDKAYSGLMSASRRHVYIIKQGQNPDGFTEKCYKA